MEVLRVIFVVAGLIWLAGKGVCWWWRGIVDATADLPPLDGDQLDRIREAHGIYRIKGRHDG